MPDFLRLLFAQTGMAADRAWRWWLAEITAILPPRLRRASSLTAEYAGEDLVFSAPPAPPAAIKLHIGGDKILRRTLRLPVAARFRLRGLLAQDLERQSPLDPSAVFFTFRILAIERAAAQLLVSLILVRREVVEAAAARIEAAGLRLKDVVVDGEVLRDERFAARRNGLLPRRHLPALALAAVAVLVAAADITVRAVRQSEVLDALNAQAAQLDAAAAHVQDLRDQVTNLQAQSGFLAARRAAPSMGAILAAITRALPDGTWLYSLDYDGAKIQLQGYSQNAAALVAIFDASPQFRDAAFRAPMTQGPAPGLQQFDLSMSLAGAP